MSHLGLVIELTILALAIFLGFEVIAKVPTMLHTPLMSGTNFIHGIVIVGAIFILGTADVQHGQRVAVSIYRPFQQRRVPAQSADALQHGPKVVLGFCPIHRRAPPREQGPIQTGAKALRSFCWDAAIRGQS